VVYTEKSSGCVCDWKTANDEVCACCYFGGKQCPFELARIRCVDAFENENLIEMCIQEASSEVLVFGEVSSEDDVIMKRGRGKLGKFGKNKLDKFGNPQEGRGEGEEEEDSEDDSREFIGDKNRFENQELSIDGQISDEPSVNGGKNSAPDDVKRKIKDKDGDNVITFDPIPSSSSKNPETLNLLFDYGKKIDKEGRKQPFVSLRANQVFSAISAELKGVQVEIDFVETALEGRSGSWCQFDGDDEKREPVTIPFFSFPETIEDQYGVRHCTDSQWMSLKNLGTAVNIIVSADNGPGVQGSYHQRIFKPCIQELARAGVPILGYVDADIGSGRRTINDIVADVMRWTEIYESRNLDGIYLNNLPGWYAVDESNIYKPDYVAQQIRSLGRPEWKVVVNPAVKVINL